MLTIQKLLYSYNSCPKIILQDLSLTVADNEFVSIVGLSGCGKSTLLHLIAGFLHPIGGNILFNGKEVSCPSPERMMIFQEDSVFPWYTVEDNIKYALRLKKKKEEEIAQRASLYIHLMGLEGYEHFFPKALSGGMRKRVDLARAYLADPELLLMDEPFGALDTHTRHKMQILLTTLWEEYKSTVVFVTHDIAEAVYLSDRVIVMSSNPGTVYEVYNIDLPRPRKPEMKHQEKFVKLVSQIEKDISILEYEMHGI